MKVWLVYDGGEVMGVFSNRGRGQALRGGQRLARHRGADRA
jgi:hypothetical protein